MNTTKKWYQSWTVWFNLALLVVAFSSEVVKIIPSSPEIVSFIALIGNFLLRFKTIMPIE